MVQDNSLRHGDDDFTVDGSTDAPIIDVQSAADIDRERMIVVQEMTLQGKTAAEISDQLDVSLSTVHRDRRKIRKLNAATVGILTHEELVGENILVLEMFRAKLMKQLQSGDVDSQRKTVETLIKIQKQIFDTQVKVGLIREADKDEILSIDGVDISGASKDQLAALVSHLNARVAEASKNSDSAKVPNADTATAEGSAAG